MGITLYIMVEYLQKTFTIKFMKDQPFPLAEKKEFRISRRLCYHAVTQITKLQRGKRTLIWL